MFGFSVSVTSACFTSVHFLSFFSFFFFNAHIILFQEARLRDPQLLYSEKYIKNKSHDIIYTFKNYFTKIFLVFNKINCIQMDP